jgi:hypothetical protein
MITRSLPRILTTLACLGAALAAPAADTRCYELRIHHANPGKLDELHQRFRNYTLDLLKKHGVQSIGYWVPISNAEDPRLFFLLSHPSREAREASWKAFSDDPAWQAAHKESEAKGPLVQRVEQYFLTATDYSPAIKPVVSDERRVFEFREYTASPGNLGRLNARFRDHTVALFAKHGMGNFGYWNLMPDQPGHENRLVYLLFHDSTEAAKESFSAFGNDENWRTARAASEKDAGGSLTVPGGVKSTFMVATDYSPTR